MSICSISTLDQHKMPSQKRVFIGTLYSGENEFQQCVESLYAQSYKNWQQTVYKNLPNKEAHETLYHDFMDKSDEFDLFLKLDADMVFMDTVSLKGIVRLFEMTKDLDHLQMVVYDWYTDSLIMGAHAFSNRARWYVKDELFVDPPPAIPSLIWRLWEDPAPFILHSPNPSNFQAFLFGVHRASKIVQNYGQSYRFDNASVQWTILVNTWQHFQKSRDIRLGLALIGAEEMLAGSVDHAQYSQSNRDDLVKVYQRYENISVDELDIFLSPLWRSDFRRKLRYQKLAAGRNITSAVWRSIKGLLIRPYRYLLQIKPG